MKIFTHVRVDMSQSIVTLIESLRSLFPEQILPKGFMCEAPLDDERTRQVLHLLEQAGLKPWDFTTGLEKKSDSEFSISLIREYDADDLAACDYLEIWPPSKAYHPEADLRTDSGEMLIPQRHLPRGFAIMSSHLYRSYFVTEHAKSVLEAVPFRGVRLKPASYQPSSHRKISTDPSNALGPSTPYWELDSDLTMPPLSPTVRLTDRDCKPVRRADFSNGMQRTDNLFKPVELHYRKSELERLEEFDLARTFEPFGNHRGYQRLFCPLVASKRFYETCVANKLKTGWAPVRVDPE
ncbi:hypothetical protein V5E97_21935 [Singulisphaera sp. Ch08]|uniref:Uncharacterized protein n=1 Tax=Singulisphaera sp. Ch08 TaxID=3120278 RepID=A0AAU7C6K0_9BACT